MGGGITPVHTVLMPDPSLAKASLQENINPALNAESRVKTPAFDRLSGFDGFADTNPFTLKNIDSYVFPTQTMCFLLIILQLSFAIMVQDGHPAATPVPSFSSLLDSVVASHLRLQVFALTFYETLLLWILKRIFLLPQQFVSVHGSQILPTAYLQRVAVRETPPDDPATVAYFYGSANFVSERRAADVHCCFSQSDVAAETEWCILGGILWVIVFCRWHGR